MSSSPCSAVTVRSEVSNTTDRRCECGKLLAKVTQAGLELKCSRCGEKDARLAILPPV